MASELSAHDQAILNCVFNPNLPLEEAIVQINEELKDEEELTPLIKEAKILEIKAIEQTEQGNLDEGFKLINQAIALAPDKPSLYNNRAHIFQFMAKYEDAFDDMNKAISLSTSKHKNTLCKAHCQRGILYRKTERIDEARKDFEISAQMGSRFARAQLVEMNPYAALCNQMLRKVMSQIDKK